MDFVELFILVLPAFVSNAVPVVFGGGTAVDFGRNFADGKRVFGDSKTIRGLLSGIVAGTAVGMLLAFAVPFLPWISLQGKFLLAFLASAGAMAGDLLGSFVKRRLGAPPGSQYFLLDQLLFLIIALGLVIWAEPAFFALLNGWDVLALLVLTYFLHLFFNGVAHKMRLKKVPW
ncbi:MAG TPA: CDP-2,3-bis-(O-geranylgeranyl)-sn-glycerol synthase [Candidatus Norongarragalinales archaeon]|nr:CDP-2,3-bis-(O-geranylgeranyl)-sn-glycerol synthase [Candidatus Norongarragalinales archaeon]